MIMFLFLWLMSLFFISHLGWSARASFEKALRSHTQKPASFKNANSIGDLPSSNLADFLKNQKRRRSRAGGARMPDFT